MYVDKTLRKYPKRWIARLISGLAEKSCATTPFKNISNIFFQWSLAID
jgi:hypothetical protein